jgi:hypothetical protein
MKKTLIGALAGLTALGAIAVAAPASARDGWRHDHDGGAAVAAGIAGLAIGAAIAGGGDRYYGPPGYYEGPPPTYYDGPTYYSYYRHCRTEWRWNAYWGRYERVRACY